jgi:hypothetical protein
MIRLVNPEVITTDLLTTLLTLLEPVRCRDGSKRYCIADL